MSASKYSVTGGRVGPVRLHWRTHIRKTESIPDFHTSGSELAFEKRARVGPDIFADEFAFKPRPRAEYDFGTDRTVNGRMHHMGVSNRNNVVLTGREDGPVVML